MPRAKRPGVTRLSDGTWRVAVSAPVEGGKANAAVGAVRIVRGLASRFKEAEVACGRC